MLTCRIIGGSIECIFGAADDSGVSDRSEVDTEFICVILAHLLVEHFADTVNGFGLEDHVIRSVVFWEMVSAENSD